MPNYIELAKRFIEGFHDKNYGYLARELNIKINHLSDRNQKDQKKIFTEMIMQVYDHFDVAIKEVKKQVKIMDDVNSFFKKSKIRTNSNGTENIRLVLELDKKEIELSELYQEYKKFREVKSDLKVLILALERNGVIDYKLIENDKTKIILERWTNEKGN